MEIIKNNIVDNIDVEPKHLEEIKRVLARTLPYKKVWAYGSRVKWTANERSDLDLAVFEATDTQIENAKEAFNESNVPFIVQLMNWQNIPDDFKKNIEEKYFVLQTEEDWAEFKLSDISDVRDGTHDSPKEKPEGRFLIASKHIKNGKIDFSSAYKISEEDFEQINKRSKVDKWDILFSMIETIAETVIVDFEPDFAIKNVGLFKTGDKNLSKWIYYYLKSTDAKNEIDACLKGSTQQYITLGDLRNFPVKIPPLPEQKAIAEVLTSLDDKIDLLHKQNKTLEQLAETLFRHHFIDNAQDDWGEGKFGDFVTPKKGKNITKSQVVEGLVPVIAGGLSPSCFHNKANTSAPVITISASGANAGHVALHHKPVWSSDSSFIDKSITPYVYFFYVFLKTNQEKITDKQEGSAQPHIYPSHLMDLDILKYPDDLILESETFLEQSFIKIGANIEQIQNLEKTRDQLLPKLMSGEIRLNQQTNNQ